MEPVISLPTELIATAETPPRGAAPLLRSPGEGGPAPPAAVPFELLLGLLTDASAGGESWPASGKKLPLPALEAAAESATAEALGPGPFAPQGLVETRPVAARAAWLLTASAVAAQDAPGLVTEASSAAVRPAAWPVAGSPFALPPVGAGEHPVGFAPTADTRVTRGSETLPVASTAPLSADALTAAEPELEGIEALLSYDARLRAQLASAAAAEPRAGAPSAAAPATSTNVPPALLDAYASSAREKLPPQPGAARALDALAVFTASAAATEAPTGLATDSLLAGHTHVHGTSGTAGTAAAPPAAPALPNAPVDARLPDWHAAFAQRVQWLVDTDAGEARIKLNPPELGAVDVKISLVDDKTHVHLTASTAAARDELAQSLPRLRELFTVSGLELGSASVHDGRGEHAGRGGQHARGADAVPRDDALAPLARRLDDPATVRHGVSRGRIDVFA